MIGAPKGGVKDPTLPNLVNFAHDTAYNPWTKNYFGIRIIPRPDKWYGLEIVAADGVEGKINVSLMNVPWDQALEQILAEHGYTFRLQGNKMTVFKK